MTKHEYAPFTHINTRYRLGKPLHPGKENGNNEPLIPKPAPKPAAPVAGRPPVGRGAGAAGGKPKWHGGDGDDDDSTGGGSGGNGGYGGNGGNGGYGGAGELFPDVRARPGEEPPPRKILGAGGGPALDATLKEFKQVCQA